MRLKVYRSGHDTSSHFDLFELVAVPGATVLSLLFDARDRYDDSLAFRYSCRGAVCGSCAMLINNVPRLACRTQVEPLLGRGPSGQGFQGSGRPGPSDPRTPEPDEVLVEPLPHLPVLKDLVVDMTKFFVFLREVQPVLRPAREAPGREYRMEPSAARELERYTNCILCGACYGACPVCGENPEYLGPAALAQLYRFHIDPREARDGSRLALADKPDGWWACRFYANCRDVCPKGVPPNLAIGRARQELKPRNPHPCPLPEGEGRGQGPNVGGEADVEN
ncbi:MAG TPA: succinate dehydrogenase/fumarate reductase iron-sulfur subunit [bacterium]|nr:succinate dehydrogenase/fumarate reductase iron-sulfur subunit [bacterium]